MVRGTLGVSHVSPESLTQVTAQLRNAQSAARAVEHIRTQLEEREELLAEAQDRANYYQGLHDDVQLDERIAAQLASKLADENRWLKARLAEASDFEAAYGTVPDDAYTRYPDNFDDLHKRLPELADVGVPFTGSVRDMLAVDDVDTVGKLATTAWDAFLVLADYVRARNAGVFDGSIKQYLKDTPQGYRTFPPDKFAERETGKTMAAWGDQRKHVLPSGVFELLAVAQHLSQAEAQLLFFVVAGDALDLGDEYSAVGFPGEVEVRFARAAGAGGESGVAEDLGELVLGVCVPAQATFDDGGVDAERRPGTWGGATGAAGVSASRDLCSPRK
jgi:hypothetical protein